MTPVAGSKSTLAGGDKEKKRGKKKKEAANVFFLKLEKEGIKISGRGWQR